MWWVIGILLIVLIIILLGFCWSIYTNYTRIDSEWIHLPFYQKLKHLGLHPPDYVHKLADKYTVKEYVQKTCEDLNVAKLAYVTDKPTLPELSSILQPNTKYMMKANNACQRNKVITLSSNKHNLERTMKEWLETPFKTANSVEKFYGQIPPKILIEEMIPNIIYEYRIFCFHGVPHYIKVKRPGTISVSYYTPEWKRTDLKHIFTPIGKFISKPDYLDQLISSAKKLSKNIAFVCVDIMATKESNLYFGEMTFTPHCSRRILVPDKYQRTLGELWKYHD